jgi:hypothetical protein
MHVDGLQVDMRNTNDAVIRLQIEYGALNNISLSMDRCISRAAQSNFSRCSLKSHALPPPAWKQGASI